MFALRLIISFFVGGLAVAFQTLIGERVPLRWRGPVLTIPSTLGLSLFFVGLTKGPLAGQEAAMIVPAALGAEFLFVTAFALVIRHGLIPSLLVSTVVILAGGVFVLLFPPPTLLSSVFFYGLPAIIAGYLIVRSLPLVSKLTPVPITPWYVAMRSLLGGSILVTVILLAKFLGNTWGGLFAAFPAVFLSTFLIYYFAHGRSVIPSVAHSMFFPGSLGLMLYAIVTLWTFPIVGIWIGTILSYLAVACFFVLYNWAKSFIGSSPTR